MLQRNLDFDSSLVGIDLISTDVFDTLLLRKGKSQRSRTAAGEAIFASRLRLRGRPVDASVLVDARMAAERCAYRALNTGEGGGEVRLTDIVQRQLSILGLPLDLVDERMAIELEIERKVLFANGVLAMRLRRYRSMGIRVVAVSDTGLSGVQVQSLIDHFHGPGLLDCIYSSADEKLTKRHGALFAEVLKREGVAANRSIHIGDDFEADKRVPEQMGWNAVHIPKSSRARLVAKADGAVTEVSRWTKKRLATNSVPPGAVNDAFVFGHDVFGPIVAEFCLRIWLYCEQASASSDATVLFCARGGIGIRHAYERLIDRLSLPCSTKRENLLVSRLVAARSAVITRDNAVLDELSREFSGDTFADVARALAFREHDLPDTWRGDFARERFFELLDTEPGKRVVGDISYQNDLFKQHLSDISALGSRMILCDTGLYGSTQRLLAAGFPDQRFETIQFARSNYKKLSVQHFSRVAGLVVEQDSYNLLQPRSSVLRYWQLVESLFEPRTASVRQLHVGFDGRVAGNGGDIRYGAIDPTAGNPLLAGAIDYIDRLADGTSIFSDVDRAWFRLRRSITNPSPADIGVLGVGPRSIDFGRPETKDVVAGATTSSVGEKIARIKSQMWREGAIARDFPRLRPALLGALEMTHIMRGLNERFLR